MPEQVDPPVVGPWAQDKLGCLADYLQAYTTALKNQPFKRVYIDAFAGAGTAYLRTDQADDNDLPALFEPEDFGEQERQVLAGSPRVALETNPPFDKYVFIERDPERLLLLEQLKAEYGATRDVKIHRGDCNGYFEQKLIAAKPPIDWRLWRGVVFLDPYGMHVPWRTIAAIAATRALEVIVNFPLGMAIHRVLPRDAAQLTIPRRLKHDAYFGDPAWFDEVYRVEEDWFRRRVVKRADAGERLLKWYVERLKTAFGHASEPREVRSSGGKPLYHLIWAGPNRLGLKIAAHVLAQPHSTRRQLTLESAARRSRP
jgi:three-Cys-motif partner protein